MEKMAEPQERDLALLSLEGRQIERLALHVELGPVGGAGARYFELFLGEPGQPRGERPVLAGLRHTGQEPAQNWIEVLRVRQHKPGEEARRTRRIEEGLLRVLADLVPPGGHMMVEYESRPETEKALALGVPPGATPLGSLMVRIGCGTAFKDWYFTEGWSEGPRKLQGYKALNNEHARRRARTTALELLDFLTKPHDAGQEQVLEPARLRAKELLRGIVTGDEDLDRRIREGSGD